ncbi:MAG: helix-turn-helix transcriptional regulator [Desmonostoc vinosum HA7617-LM4]|nr:helix-turn-helix transcriptional regulator [Desmonostoc vinosum HA7617-LM4]
MRIVLANALHQTPNQNTVAHLKDPTYIPSSKILEALCETYKIQPGEILEWFPAQEKSEDD